MIFRAFRYRLYPTPEQATALAEAAGVVRFVYNLAWEQRRDFWRQFRAATGQTFNHINQGREIKGLRAEVDWIAAACATTLHHALRDLDRAFAGFFAGRSDFPTPRKRGVNESFRHKGPEVHTRQLNAKWAGVKVPKIGWIKFRSTRPICGRVTSVTFSASEGKWFATFASEIQTTPAPAFADSVGVDRGVANSAALSTGEFFSVPANEALQRRKARGQRILARRMRGSKRRERQQRRVARIAGRIARGRKDWAHKASLSIARRFGMVAIERLQIANMTKAGSGKRGLNRSILEQAWGSLERFLAYKIEERGGRLVTVNPAYTSQECSACGTIDKASRESQASFACRHCGFAGHADTNAAINILRRGTALMRAEGGDCAPVETRTEDHALAA